jgi:hypothetical protein
MVDENVVLKVGMDFGEWFETKYLNFRVQRTSVEGVHASVGPDVKNPGCHFGITGKYRDHMRFPVIPVLPVKAGT